MNGLHSREASASNLSEAHLDLHDAASEASAAQQRSPPGTAAAAAPGNGHPGGSRPPLLRPSAS